MATRIGLSPDVRRDFPWFSEVRPHLMYVSTVVYDHEWNAWWEQSGRIFRPVVVHNKAQALEVLTKLAKMYPNAENVPQL